MWTFGWLETTWQDLRYALRGMGRNPLFAFTATASLALGIGASVAIFTVVDNVLLRPLTYQDPKALVMVWEVNARRDFRKNVISPSNYLDWKSRSHVFSSMAALSPQSTIALNVGSAPAEEIGYRSVTPEFFPLLGVNAQLGRAFSQEDARPGAARTALISSRLWNRDFGGDSSVLGRNVRLNGEQAIIIGVLPASFYFLDREVDVWTPLPLDPFRNYRATSGRSLSCVARLRTGVSVKTAAAEMEAIGKQLAAAYPAFNTGWSATVETLRDSLVHNVETSLYVLLGAVGLLLCVASANVANLLLSRFSARQQELAIRVSIGAGRGRITRQVLTEGAVLGCIGGVGGIAIAYFAIQALLKLAPRELAWAGPLSIDIRILSFAIGLSMITGLLVGLVPSHVVSSASRTGGLLQQSQRSGGGGQRVRWLLVSFEIALGVLLISGAGLLFKTLVRLQTSPSGYDARNILTMKVSVSGVDYQDAASRVRFFNNTAARLRELPGIKSTAAVSFIPLHGFPAGTGLNIQGHPDLGPGNKLTANVRVVTPENFQTAGIPVRQGREFEAADNRIDAPFRFIVNDAFVNKYMRGEDPIGRKISVDMSDENPYGDIIGVTGDITDGTRESWSRPTVYYVHAHLALPTLIVLIRTAAAPESLSIAARQSIRELDSRATVSEVATMEQVLGETIARERFSALLFAVFSTIALALSAIGVYGVLSYTVAERTREIGVRIAIGARPSSISWMFAAKAFRFTLAGSLVGVTAAIMLSRTLQSLLYETSPLDPLALSFAPVLLIGIAHIASWIPAKRAARLNPVEALRADG